ncbi:MAG: hypothetical protein U0412_09945 [Nitrospira sp.]
MARALQNKLTRPCALTMLLMVLGGCATTDPADDPLKHTRKLVVEGHVSLYENGAFNVPQTSIRLIPAGPSAWELVGELMGLRARQAFLLAVSKAKESVTILAEGTTLSYHMAEGIHQATDTLTDELKKATRENSVLLASRSWADAKGIVGKSWELSKETAADMDRLGIAMIERSLQRGDALSGRMSEQGRRLVRRSLEQAQDLSKGGTTRASDALSFAGERFVKGYAAVPANAKARAKTVGDDIRELNLPGIVDEESERRRRWSKQMTDLAGETVSSYREDVAHSFKEAKREIADYRTSGISLATLRSLRWVLQGLFWDAAIEPIGKISAASVGYLSVNTLAYPTLVAVREGKAMTEIAVEVAWNASKSGYDLVAPSATAAVASLYGVLDFTGSNLAAGAVAGGGSLAGLSERATSQVVGVTIKGSGYAAGKTVQYVGVPLAAAGVAVGRGTLGVVAGTTEAAAASTVLVAGGTGMAATYITGNAIAGTTLLGGTAATVGAAAWQSYYQLAKAVVLPAGFQFAGGMVLSYGTMAHLGAHTILAAADMSYLVLSLEGPRWVLYAVKGKLGKGEDLVPGTMLDLKSMQDAGEEIYNIPVSDEEMKNVVESVYGELPEVE